MTCSLDEFEVCSNGAAETQAHSAAPVAAQPSQVSQSEVDTAPDEAPSDNEEEAGGHEDSCSTDDDQFSDVGEAPDTEVVTAGTAIACCHAHQLSPSLASSSYALDCFTCPEHCTSSYRQ